MRYQHQVGLAWFLLCVATGSFTAAGTMLTHQYKPGETFTYELITDISTTATESGGEGGKERGNLQPRGGRSTKIRSKF